ncbi:hypothetical protein [Legionella worsleiensis]|uniref:Uncharacterized protein n=1 Tax=Legionella worsleiensis TaxID=45076 RepID=A0A0W1AGD8_9GAMM|nr:hypothetical protein [Legionella worsleiensis]KTD80240.1 hypothetical protein Lwor_1148 [Legionella worsleiensis]STY31665.1 Uncharacterised protein [Legionella worsleiensis]
MPQNSENNQSKSINYDPFIHGTTSATLSLMTKTNFQLMPTLKMIDDHTAAPVVGELTQGGYNFLGFKLVQQEDIGAISFGRLIKGHYNLKKITASYTQFNPPTSDKTLKDLKHSLKYSIASGFSSFNLLLIYFTRARQMHQSLDQVITKNELDTLNQQLHATVQFYYFIQLLETHIFPDVKAIKEALTQNTSLTKRDITDAVYSLLSFEDIVNKIILNKIDMKAIVLNPTEENLRKALKILELPQNPTIKSGFGAVNKDIELPITQFFGLEKQAMSGRCETYREDHFGYFCRNINGYQINNYLERSLSTADVFEGISKDAKKYIQALEDRIRVFDKLVNAPQEQFKLTDNQQALLKSTYPIIFVSESESIKPYGSEYRSNTPLKIGDDIRIIATDTNNHRVQLQNYLYNYQINPVQVVLFSDLEKAIADPSSLPLTIDSQELRTMLTKTKNNKHGALFYELYQLLDGLNDKRNKFRSTDPQAFKAMDHLLSEINNEMKNTFPEDQAITGNAIRAFCLKSTALIKEQQNVFAQHRGVWGILDTVLTVLASLIVLYPAVYLYQKTNNIKHTFFNTDSSIKAQNTMAKLSQINTSAADFSDEESIQLDVMIK